MSIDMSITTSPSVATLSLVAIVWRSVEKWRSSDISGPAQVEVVTGWIR
jgi:hypothetical protein